MCFRNIRQRRRVYDIVSFLPLGDLEVLKRHWVKGGATGVTKELFLENMLRVRTSGLCCCGLQVRSTDLLRPVYYTAARDSVAFCRSGGWQVLTLSQAASQRKLWRWKGWPRVSVLPLLEEHDLGAATHG